MTRYLVFAVFLITGCVHLNKQREIKYEFVLPAPTGDFKIGTVTGVMIDTARRDHRVVMQIWYPAHKHENKSMALYLQPELANHHKSAMAEASNLPVARFDNLNNLRSHAMLAAQLSDETDKHPVIFFSPALGMPAQLYTSLTEELASFGYVVIGINHDPYPPVGPEVDVWHDNDALHHASWIADLKFVLDKLHNNSLSPEFSFLNKHVNLDQIGFAGHSFGGSAAIQMCFEDKRCKAAANIDGGLFAKEPPEVLTKPALFIEQPNNLTIDDEKMMAMITAMLKQRADLKTNSRKKVPVFSYEVLGADHMTFSDMWLLDTNYQRAPNSLEPNRGVAITRSLLVWFFDTQLRHKPTPSPVAKFPEIR